MVRDASRKPWRLVWGQKCAGDAENDRDQGGHNGMPTSVRPANATHVSLLQTPLCHEEDVSSGLDSDQGKYTTLLRRNIRWRWLRAFISAGTVGTRERCEHRKWPENHEWVTQGAVHVLRTFDQGTPTKYPPPVGRTPGR